MLSTKILWNHYSTGAMRCTTYWPNSVDHLLTQNPKMWTTMWTTYWPPNPPNVDHYWPYSLYIYTYIHSYIFTFIHIYIHTPESYFLYHFFCLFNSQFRYHRFSKVSFLQQPEAKWKLETVPPEGCFLYHLRVHFWPSKVVQFLTLKVVQFLTFIWLYVFRYLELIGALEKRTLIESQVGISVVFLTFSNLGLIFITQPFFDHLALLLFLCSFFLVDFLCPFFHVIFFNVMLALLQQTRKNYKNKKKATKKEKENSKDRRKWKRCQERSPPNDKNKEIKEERQKMRRAKERESTEVVKKRLRIK